MSKYDTKHEFNLFRYESLRQAMVTQNFLSFELDELAILLRDNITNNVSQDVQDIILAILINVLPLINKFAYSFTYTNQTIGLEDLQQHAVTLIYTIVKTYDPSKGHFLGFFIRCFRNSIIALVVRDKNRSHLSLDATDVSSNQERERLRWIYKLMIDIEPKRPVENLVMNNALLFKFLESFLGIPFILHMEGFTKEQIIRQTGIGSKSFDNRIVRGKQNYEALKYYLEGYSYEEIGQIMGINPDTLNKRFSRALEIET